MITNEPIKSLYMLALAEGEGVGTAYEYYAKRLVLSPWLNRVRPKRILVAGLPEKYGSSLDFVLLAAELEAKLTVVDERDLALNRFEQSLASARHRGRLAEAYPVLQRVSSLYRLDEVAESFDLCLSSEALQRISSSNRLDYFQRVRELAPASAIFAPNGDNPAHTSLSGLSGVLLPDLDSLIGRISDLAGVAQPDHHWRSGYIDMPPFPPGILRDKEQRAQASSGKFEAVAMWGLAYYARVEKLFPHRWRRRQSHIVYALT